MKAVLVNYITTPSLDVRAGVVFLDAQVIVDSQSLILAAADIETKGLVATAIEAILAYSAAESYGLIESDIKAVADYITKQKIIKTLGDFPAPSGGVITLEDNTTYIINGTVDIGTNRIVCGIKNTFRGFDRQNDILQSSTTGNMFTMDNSSTPKVSLIFDTLTLKATAGTLLNVSGGSTDQVTFITTSISSTVTGGSLSGVAFSMRTSSVTSLSTAGFTFTGTNVSFTLRDSSITGNTGTAFNLSSATFSNVIRISRNFISVPASQTFLNATSTTVSIIGRLALNDFTGSGTFLTGVTGETANWLFTDNTGITNSIISYLPSPTGNASKFLRVNAGETATEWATIAGGGDLLAANNLSDLANASTARTNLGLGTLATQSGTFSGTSSGTNTGDQTLPVKATGAEVDTGTDDAKFLTPKAIEDSAYIKAAYADALVADAINNGTTTIAPSQNAVFDALALKAPLASPTFTGTVVLPTGDATNAPLNMPAGTLKTTPADGDIEIDGNCLYACTDAGNRGYIPVRHFIRCNATRTLPSDSNLNAIFNSPTNGRLTLETGTYLFEAVIGITAMSATSGNASVDVLGAGTATVGDWLYAAIGKDGTLVSVNAVLGVMPVIKNTPASMFTAGTGAEMWFTLKGTFTVTVAGTLIPSIDQVTGASAVVAIGSYFTCERIGDTSVVSVGQWD